MSTTILPKDYESAMKVIGKFAKNVFAGNDETQKKDLHENLLVLAKLRTDHQNLAVKLQVKSS